MYIFLRLNVDFYFSNLLLNQPSHLFVGYDWQEVTVFQGLMMSCCALIGLAWTNSCLPPRIPPSLRFSPLFPGWWRWCDNELANQRARRQSGGGEQEQKDAATGREEKKEEVKKRRRMRRVRRDQLSWGAEQPEITRRKKSKEEKRRRRRWGRRSCCRCWGASSSSSSSSSPPHPTVMDKYKPKRPTSLDLFPQLPPAGTQVCVCVCVSICYVHVCLCVCFRERERERELGCV